MATLLLLSAIKFLINGISPLFQSESLRIALNSTSTFIIFLIFPTYYIYIKELYIGYKIKKSTSIHFVLPTVMGLLLAYYNYAFNQQLSFELKKMVVIIAMGSAFFYGLLIQRTLKSKKSKLESDIPAFQKQNNIIKKWGISLSLICLTFTLIGAIPWIFLIYFKSETLIPFVNLPGLLIWFGLFSFYLTNPEFIQRFNSLGSEIETLKSKSIQLNRIWITKIDPLTISSVKDQKLSDKINEQLINYMYRIEQVSFFTDFFRNPDCGIIELSTEINAPSSHISYIFKYHSSVSFTDFKKIVRIQDATNLLRTDFLKTNTIESLAMKVGFSSYTPFFSSFKNIKGMSPQDFINKLEN
jgi:AraC-like DNA-binding protein